ncbi:hypothetical protein [Methylobacterium planeticum]|uniref:CopL family metal-binding regulatory protein n=1 Tax=Methylobacterium planeticum TaxID=2615211 RepID=A0A6N6MLQ9_9HYPH|nr:hypothetical protein [Methylobacterium planeticum]KAB1071612.1 hypothetical protein F6X51_18780 [Methylobacterium planeticum]
MNLARPLARLLATMIVMIVAALGAGAVEAHEGHAHHHAPPAAAAETRAAPAAVAMRPKLTSGESAPDLFAPGPFLSGKATVPVAALASLAPTKGAACCPGACRDACCGTLACCATGILTGAPILPPRGGRHVARRPREAPARGGLGPETLPEPPRPLA